MGLEFDGFGEVCGDALSPNAMWPGIMIRSSYV